MFLKGNGSELSVESVHIDILETPQSYLQQHPSLLPYTTYTNGIPNNHIKSPFGLGRRCRGAPYVKRLLWVSNMMKDAKEIFEAAYSHKTPEEIEKENQERQRLGQEEHDRFLKAYNNDCCYLCGKPFKTIRKSNPCLHWLLRRCKFKKKDFPKIIEKYSYVQMESYLRWVANADVFLKNVNNLTDEKTKGKIIQSTIKWKDIEWSFDCSMSDFEGHKGTNSEFPHYHFQMRINGQQFINYNDFHIQLTKNDEFILSLMLDGTPNFHHTFGAGGMGMEEAMSVDFDLLLENPDFKGDEHNGIYHMQSVIQANSEEGIPGELIDEAFEESRKTGISATKILREKLADHASMVTIVSPSENVPDLAKRTERKKKT